jgi:hypothetical protein
LFFNHVASVWLLTVIGATDLQLETNEEESIRNVLEAQIVDEDEREKIERELRQKHHEELGQVAPQAEVMVDDGSNARRRAFLCSGVVVVILGTVLGTRDTSQNTTADRAYECWHASSPVSVAAACWHCTQKQRCEGCSLSLSPAKMQITISLRFFTQALIL